MYLNMVVRIIKSRITTFNCWYKNMIVNSVPANMFLSGSICVVFLLENLKEKLYKKM